VVWGTVFSIYMKEADSRLVEPGKKLNARILANDLNLNKVAVLRVQVLNINGRMIFTRLQEPADQDALSFAHG